MAAGWNHSLALKSNRAVIAWGGDGAGQCDVPSGLSGVMAVSAGTNNSLALKSDGTVIAWGANKQGQFDVPEGLNLGGMPSNHTISRKRNTPSPTVNAAFTAGTYKVNLPVNINKEKNSITASLSEDILNKAFDKAKPGSDGVKTAKAEMPEVQGVDTYVLQLPATALALEKQDKKIEMASETGTITLPGNMLEGMGLENNGDVGISIGKTDISRLPQDVQDSIGENPVVELKLTSGGKTIEWNNPDAPVTVSIPYIPTAEELANPEHITVWYIDGSGKAVSVPNGRYDPATGMVTFSTTHFSNFAVVYVTITFEDLGNVGWAKEQIEVLASKGIVRGMSEKEYAPQANITRADFLCFLVRTLGVDAKVNGNFDDINSDSYYYKEIAIAKRLGITSGTGNNRFSPDASITRQDMMVLTERTLRMLSRLKAQVSASDLDKFADKSLVATYAVDSIAALVKEGLIVGGGDNVNPLGNTTRAEAAVFLYRIYNKY